MLLYLNHIGGSMIAMVIGGMITAAFGLIAMLSKSKKEGLPSWVAWGAFAGGIIVVLGGLWSGIEQSKTAEELQKKTQEVAELTRKAADSITGGDSFCYVTLLFLDRTKGIATVDLASKGKYPLYDVSVKIADLQKNRQLQDQMSLKDQISLKELFEILQGNVIKVGNLRPGSSFFLGTIKIEPPGKDYYFYMTARNGFFRQPYLIRFTGKKWTIATKVIKDIVGKPEQFEELYKRVDKDFPLDQLKW